MPNASIRGPVPTSPGTAPSPDRLLTQSQTAEYLALSERTLEGWRLRGEGPPFVRLSRNAVRYRLRDLDAWIAARREDRAAYVDAA